MQAILIGIHVIIWLVLSYTVLFRCSIDISVKKQLQLKLHKIKATTQGLLVAQLGKVHENYVHSVIL